MITQASRSVLATEASFSLSPKCVRTSRKSHLIAVFMVLKTGVVVHETVQLLKAFVLLFCL